MRGPLVFAAIASLAGCGPSGEPPNGVADANQIERLSTPKELRPDPQATVRLQTIGADDVQREGLSGPGCWFSREGRMLLAAFGSDSLIRIAGELRHMIHSAPVGPTGGFFEDRHLSVSVGRDNENGTPAAGGGTSWPARATVTNRRTQAQLKLRGSWTCVG